MLIAFSVFCQNGIDNFWLMGVHGTNNTPINIDFISGTPNVYTTSRPMNFEFSESLISDTTGNLLFYSNGCYIANSLNNLMFDGDSLNPGNCTSNHCPNFGNIITDGNIVIPMPGTSNNFFLFHETCDNSSPAFEPSKLYYSIIDMSQQGGLGAVIEKNQIIINGTLTVGFLSAVRHGNGRDWWVVVHSLIGDTFYTMLLTPAGIQGPVPQTYGPILQGPWHDGAGQTEFSPDGSKLATSTWWTSYDTSGNGVVIPDLHLFDFDRCTGQFSNHQLIYSNPTNHGGGGGLSFSPSSRFLYLTTLDTVLQFDLYSSNISASKLPVVVNTSSSEKFWFSQLAYDNRIYITDGTILELHSFSTINYPDSLGSACSSQLHNIQLPNYCFQTIPNYPNYRLGSLTGSACDTLTTIYERSSLQTRLTVYPNPSLNGIFHFRFSDNSEQIKQLEITDLIGRKVYVFHKNISEVDIYNAQNGLYFYSVQTKSDKIFKGKLLKE